MEGLVKWQLAGVCDIYSKCSDQLYPYSVKATVFYQGMEIGAEVENESIYFENEECGTIAAFMSQSSRTRFCASPGNFIIVSALLTEEVVKLFIPMRYEEFESASKQQQIPLAKKTRNRAYLLTQLRTGHNWLSTYAKKFGFREDDLCECGVQETVAHVLMECPRLRELRVELRRKTGDTLSGVSSLLGGSNEGEKGKPDIVSKTKTLRAVLDFAEASQRFRSRAP
ncbi:hypothetical protein PENSUB_4339 [Penicillium subrubescens]|uniref:Reverse transcriptase zinc-binding domain-containing protein n=1 Tax=Penicillium subrubescens TaxID=1316194 RepID=A0A1Q5UCR4_9EURO|nr:hypothetical protein PENSUB_4339 [Penicillium subrubescens]